MLTTAVAARTGAHNDGLAGRTRDEAIRYTDWLVRSIACEHVAVTPGGWGAGWQTAHWAFLAGEAAWLVWDELTPQTREYVAQMVVYEADRRLIARHYLHLGERQRRAYFADNTPVPQKKIFYALRPAAA